MISSQEEIFKLSNELIGKLVTEVLDQIGTSTRAASVV